MNLEIGHRHVVKVLLRADGQGSDGDGDDQVRSVEARPGSFAADAGDAAWSSAIRVLNRAMMGIMMVVGTLFEGTLDAATEKG